MRIMKPSRYFPDASTLLPAHLVGNLLPEAFPDDPYARGRALPRTERNAEALP